jgi:hypothetical protein
MLVSILCTLVSMLVTMSITRTRNMSLNETSNLIAQSRKIIESGQDDTTNSNTVLNIILQIELPNVKVHTNSDIIKQIFTLCEKSISET